MQRRLLSKTEVIEFTGKSFPTLWQWMRDGKFPAARRIGSRAMWLSDEIDAWLNAQPIVEYKQLQRRS
jgi:predicted DNA-binding transcriptional regulator AlpA